MSSLNYIYKNQSYQQIIEYKKELILLLNEVVEIIEKHNVKYMLDCGTLLGFVRDKKMIKDDGDCDLFIFGETITLPFIKELIDKGLMRNEEKSQFMSLKMFEKSFLKGIPVEPLAIKVENTRKSFFRQNNPIHPSIDLFVFVPYGPERFSRFIRSSYVRHNRQITDEVIDYKMQYGTYKIPKNYDALLKCYYGDGWTVPDPKFHDETRDISKYGWYGMCDRETVGKLKINYQTMEVTESTGIAKEMQRKIGLIDDNGNITNLNILEYFKTPTPKDLERLFDPVKHDIHRFFANWALCRLSGMKKSNHIVANWQYFTPNERKKLLPSVKDTMGRKLDIE